MVNIVPVAGIDDYVIVSTVIVTTIITTVISPMVGTINTDRHHGCKAEPGRIIPIVVRWNIRHIGR